MEGHSSFKKWLEGTCLYTCSLCESNFLGLKLFKGHIYGEHDLTLSEYGKDFGQALVLDVSITCKLCGKPVLHDEFLIRDHFKTEHKGHDLEKYFETYVRGSKSKEDALTSKDLPQHKQNARKRSLKTSVKESLPVVKIRRIDEIIGREVGTAVRGSQSFSGSSKANFRESDSSQLERGLQNKTSCTASKVDQRTVAVKCRPVIIPFLKQNPPDNAKSHRNKTKKRCSWSSLDESDIVDIPSESENVDDAPCNGDDGMVGQEDSNAERRLGRKQSTIVVDVGTGGSDAARAGTNSSPVADFSLSELREILGSGGTKGSRASKVRTRSSLVASTSKRETKKGVGAKVRTNSSPAASSSSSQPRSPNKFKEKFSDFLAGEKARNAKSSKLKKEASQVDAQSKSSDVDIPTECPDDKKGVSSDYNDDGIGCDDASDCYNPVDDEDDASECKNKFDDNDAKSTDVEADVRLGIESCKTDPEPKASDAKSPKKPRQTRESSRKSTKHQKKKLDQCEKTNTKGLFICELCGAKLATERDFNIHMSMHTAEVEEPGTSDDDNEPFQMPEPEPLPDTHCIKLKQDYGAEWNKCEYGCTECPFQSRTWLDLTKHLRQAHNFRTKNMRMESRGRYYRKKVLHTCRVCKKEVPHDLGTIMKHLTTHKMSFLRYVGKETKGKGAENIMDMCEFKCPKCEFVSRAWNVMYKHIEKVHSKGPLQRYSRISMATKVAEHTCRICKCVLLHDRSIIATHVSIMHAMSLITYEERYGYNPDSTISKEDFLRHRAGVVDQCWFQCPECSFQCGSWKDLELHLEAQHGMSKDKICTLDKKGLATVCTWFQCTRCPTKVLQDFCIIQHHMSKEHGATSFSMQNKTSPKKHACLRQTTTGALAFYRNSVPSVKFAGKYLSKTLPDQSVTSQVENLCVFMCPHCQIAKTTWETMRTHMEKNHKDYTMRLGSVQEQAKVCIEARYHRCKLCSKDMICDRTVIRKHLKNIHHKLTLKKYAAMIRHKKSQSKAPPSPNSLLS